MNREEAIRRLRYIRMDYLGYPPFLEPIDMAIEALQIDFNDITESPNDVVESKDDAIKVVFCKDCRWGDVLDSFDSGFCGNSNGLQGYITKDDYCSFGERREP